MFKIASIVVALVLVVFAVRFVIKEFFPTTFLSPAIADVGIDDVEQKTHKEMQAWLAKLKKADKKLEDAEERVVGYTMEERYVVGLRYRLWDRENVLRKAANWRIAHLEDESKKDLVQKAFHDVVDYGNYVSDAIDDEQHGSGGPYYALRTVVDSYRRMVKIWLLPDEEYEEWMSTWSNATLSFQGRLIPLTSGLAHVKLQENDYYEDELELLVRQENCFSFGDEKYALLETNFVACPTDDFYCVYVCRLGPDGVGLPIDCVLREFYPTKMSLSKSSACLDFSWEDGLFGEKGTHWTLLVE